MKLKVVLASLLLTTGWGLLSPDSASACLRRGGSDCGVSCYVPCCDPCPPCHGCYCLAVNPCYGPGQPYSVLVWCPCCPHHCPGWSYCYVYRYHCWKWVYVYHCYPYGAQPSAEAPPYQAPTPGVEGGGGSTSLTNPATLVVDLPGSAKLTIDGQPTRSTSASRVFVTPPLSVGKTFYYDLKAEIPHDGGTVSVNRRVAVRAGEETRVNIELPATAVAAE